MEQRLVSEGTEGSRVRCWKLFQNLSISSIRQFSPFCLSLPFFLSLFFSYCSPFFASRSLVGKPTPLDGKSHPFPDTLQLVILWFSGSFGKLVATCWWPPCDSRLDVEFRSRYWDVGVEWLSNEFDVGFACSENRNGKCPFFLGGLLKFIFSMRFLSS